jgi:hypothetical protein
MFDQALKVAEGIEEADGRAWALRVIAEGMARVGKVEQAMEVFNQALRVAEGIEEAWAGMGIEGDCRRDGEGREGRAGNGSF